MFYGVFLLELVLLCFLPIINTSFLLQPEPFTVLETGWDLPSTASQHKVISCLKWLNCCIEKEFIFTVTLRASKMIHHFVYALKAASEEHALVRGTKTGDDFIWQHLILTVCIGTYPFRQLCRLGNSRNRHEIITIKCLQRIVLIHDCLKIHKHILPQWFYPFPGTLNTQETFPLHMAVKTKPLGLLPNLFKVYMDLSQTNVVENYIQWFGYWPMHLLTSQQYLFQILMQISKLSSFLFGL